MLVWNLFCFVIFGLIMNGIPFFLLAFRRVKNEGYQNLGLFFYGKSFLQIPLFKVQTFFIRGNSPVNLVRSKHTLDRSWQSFSFFLFQKWGINRAWKHWKLSLNVQCNQVLNVGTYKNSIYLVLVTLINFRCAPTPMGPKYKMTALKSW